LQSPSAPCWRSVPSQAIAFREWDGEFVVRNERTGNSHLLGPLAGRVLGVLLDAGDCLDAAEIAARLEPSASSTEASEAQDDVEDVLAEFRRLGLAELDSK
jgi:PqqD family protein of HPr-rel-A system